MWVFKSLHNFLGKEEGWRQGYALEAKGTTDVLLLPSTQLPPAKLQLWHFVGVAGYCRAFCHTFASIVSPLTALVIPPTMLMWDFRCERAFQAVKAVLCNSPVLAAPNFAVLIKLEVDVSGAGVGAVFDSERFSRHWLPSLLLQEVLKDPAEIALL